MKQRHIRAEKIGTSPGSLVYTGRHRNQSMEINLIEYDKASYCERVITNIEECLACEPPQAIRWWEIKGLYQEVIIEKIGQHFGIHPLVLEDILNVHERPKAEDFENYIFIVLKALIWDEEKKEVEQQQISFILGKNFVISFQEKNNTIFEPIKQRIKIPQSRIRSMGADYLLYALMDIIIDHYFVVLENIGEITENLEDKLLVRPDKGTLRQIQHLKRKLILLRKSIWPLKEAISFIEKSESELVTRETALYFRDVYDHTVQIIDLIETFNDQLTGMLDIYLSSLSNKMNEIMTLLTIIATIFIPLTLITGIYGMNFRYMPELNWKWGYPTVLIIMLVIGLGMLFYFKKKRWI